ncbi:ankyrin repeat domain-containing protein 17-like [Strongylocentrotus purpuratus]|uniref:Death domain-containing protein n=1 Tax=Strongylocentrotus purpuratus TaxID=7668 RepID=A0A7M7P1I2_STRPU|nr:ankyrin repeat domain-containing protein 17-like [Strongylocentrotus purpuratus]
MAERVPNEPAEVDKALLSAVINGRLNVVQYLAGQGAQIDTYDSNGKTPLHVATLQGLLEVVQYLIGKGAQVDKPTKEGTTALLFASDAGHLDVVEYLVGQGAKVEECGNNGVTPLYVASQKGHLEVVKYLAGQGAQIEESSNAGFTPLHVASQNGHLKVVEYLAGQGAQIEESSNDGFTPLHVASQEGHLDVVEYLVSQGAHVDSCNDVDATPLHVASNKGHLDVVQYLIGKGAQIDKPTKTGATAFLFASGAGHLDVVQYLTSKQADKEEASPEGITEASLGNTNFTSPRPLASKVFDIPPQGTSAAVGEVSTSTARSHLKREEGFDGVLKKVACLIPDNTKIHSLGKALGFDPAEIERYIATNTRCQHVTYNDGTLKMLRDWRDNQTDAEERPALADALKLAGLERLTDMFSRNSKVPDLQTGITQASLVNTNSTSPRPSTSASKVVDIPLQGESAAVGVVSTSTARKVSDAMLNNLARKIPVRNYDTFSERLGVEHNQAMNILESIKDGTEKF